MKRTFSIVLAVLGALFVLAPVLAPLAFLLVRAASGAPPRFDYLMPAELAPVALLGTLLVVAAAVMSKTRRLLAALGVVLAVLGLVGGMAVAVLSGIADGTREAVGWPVWLTNAGIGVYALALVESGVTGILIARDVARAGTPRHASPAERQG